MSLAARLVRRQAYLDQLAENAGGLARVAMTYDTTGTGELQLNRPTSFEGVGFIAEPIVLSGVALAAGRLRADQYPNVSAGVWRWQKTSKGLYTGAWLFFVCDVAQTLDLGATPNLRLRHSVVVEGNAIRLLPASLRR